MLEFTLQRAIMHRRRRNMKRPFILLFAPAIVLASFTGCRRSLEPPPLSDDQRREFMEQLEEVDRLEGEAFDSGEP